MGMGNGSETARQTCIKKFYNKIICLGPNRQVFSHTFHLCEMSLWGILLPNNRATEQLNSSTSTSTTTTIATTTKTHVLANLQVRFRTRRIPSRGGRRLDVNARSLAIKHGPAKHLHLSEKLQKIKKIKWE